MKKFIYRYTDWFYTNVHKIMFFIFILLNIESATILYRVAKHKVDYFDFGIWIATLLLWFQLQKLNFKWRKKRIDGED